MAEPDVRRDWIEASVPTMSTGEGRIVMCLQQVKRGSLVMQQAHTEGTGSADQNRKARRGAGAACRWLLRTATGQRMGLAVLALGLVAGCTTLTATPPVQPLPSDEAFAWSSVLHDAVDEQGRVDFRALAANRGALEIAVAGVGAKAPANAPGEFPTRQDELAFHINAYNALAMYAVLRSGIPGRLSSVDRVDFFRLTKIVVGGQPTSLYDYERDVIRRFGDVRVQFALDCMAVSCPRLQRAPFTAADLDAELDAAARRFLTDPRNVQVDRMRRVVRLSPLLDAYKADFLRKAPSLAAYANRYRAEPIPTDYSVEIIPYDWTINSQPRR